MAMWEKSKFFNEKGGGGGDVTIDTTRGRRSGSHAENNFNPRVKKVIPQFNKLHESWNKTLRY